MFLITPRYCELIIWTSMKYWTFVSMSSVMNAKVLALQRTKGRNEPVSKCLNYAI